MRRGPVSVEKLLADLAVDPVFVAAEHERERKRLARAAECADEDGAIAAEARQLGLNVTSVWDFVNNTGMAFLGHTFNGPYRSAYPLLIRHLAIKHDPRVREGLIRALTVKDGGPEVAEALLNEFRTEQSPTLRWVLANALRTSMPYAQRRRIPEIQRAYKSEGRE